MLEKPKLELSKKRNQKASQKLFHKHYCLHGHTAIDDTYKIFTFWVNANTVTYQLFSNLFITIYECVCLHACVGVCVCVCVLGQSVFNHKC